jgi:hypothetical protein
MSTTLSASTTSRPLSRAEVIAKYPEVSPFVILKTDVQRRGVHYTARALDAVDPQLHLTQVRTIFGGDPNGEARPTPVSFSLRDGTYVLTSPNPLIPNPYIVDYRDGRTVLVDNDEIVDEVEYWYRPHFLDKTTSRGTPMWQVVAVSRPNRLDFNPYGACHFWDDGKGCRYCNVGAVWKRHGHDRPARVDSEDAFETLREALKQPGRFVNFQITGGSIPGDDNRFTEEVEGYLDLLKALGRNFTTRRFPSHLLSSAFTEDHLVRFREETGLLTWTSDIEVLDAEKFAWICPGKEARVGWREWIRRLERGVEIFGRGYVNTGFVAGVELCKPRGFATEDEALSRTLETAEWLAQKGIVAVGQVFRPAPGSAFAKQSAPSLEYFVRLAKGLDAARRRQGLHIDLDDYRRCGNHGDTDLARL